MRDTSNIADKLIDHLRKHKDVPEIPRSQRSVDRSLLAKIFTEKVVRDKEKRDRKITEAVERQLFSQRENADHLGLRYTSVSRIINRRG
jgi:putative transposase